MFVGIGLRSIAKRSLSTVGFIAASLTYGGAQTRPVETAAVHDMVLSRWESDRWAVQDGIKIERNVGKSPQGELLTRITLSPNYDNQTLFTHVNLPPTATTITAFVRKTENGAATHQALFQDDQGFGGGGGSMGRIQGDSLYSSDAAKSGWSWTVGFFNAHPRAPFRLRGFRLAAGNDKDRAGKIVTAEVGPIHVNYTPDDKDWLYTDLQPKTITMRDGTAPHLTLRVANLGTQPRRFRLTALPVERNLATFKSTPVEVGSLSLQAGELKEIPIKLPIALFGRYVVQYRAEGAQPAAAKESISVVNGLSSAAGFHHWTAGRKWFTVPSRRGGLGKDGKVKLIVGTAGNVISAVPIFAVQARVPWIQTLLVEKPTPLNPNTMTMMTSQLTPAWLVRSGDTAIRLFWGTRAQGLGGPSHIAFATAKGVTIIEPGTNLGLSALKAMSQPWLIAWWQGSEGWTTWDVPYFVSLQHHPNSLTFDGNGVKVGFAGPVGYIATMPLFGYAKLPQENAFRQNPDQFRLSANWPANELQTWKWTASLPAMVTERANWWSAALLRFPYNVHETFQINHAAGSVQCQDTFDYLTIRNDWNTVPRTIAPFSPTLALALKSNYPMTVAGHLTDCRYPTLFGPYTGIEGAEKLSYTLNIGPYWMQTVDPNLTRPANESTPARQAQSRLLNWANEIATNTDGHAWDYHDGNFVWYANGQSNRDPAIAGAFLTGGFRTDLKNWMQGKTLYSLLDPSRYNMDERSGTLTRRYIDGPGIGNFGSGDWGDSGKLGTDMIYDAWVYAYTTGDYQLIADKWDMITSLNVTPSSMNWLGVGRAAVAEMGDEASPQLALARLAYAVGDEDTYTAAVYWYARELVHHNVKDGGFTKWRDQFRPWTAGNNLSTETPTNLWGTNASWEGGGAYGSIKGDNQWQNFYVRLDDLDTIRFMREHCQELPRRVVEAPMPPDSNQDWLNYNLYFDRVVILNQDVSKADAKYQTVMGDKKPIPDNFALRFAEASHEFPPKTVQLIPSNIQTFVDKGFANDQMNNASYGMISQSDIAVSYTDPNASKSRIGKLPTPQWYHYRSPQQIPGIEWGERWTFGSIGPDGAALAIPPVKSSNPSRQTLNPQSSVYTYTLESINKQGSK